MPRTARILLDNAAYHIMTRGNQKQRVFIENIDFQEYLNRLKYYKREFEFKLYGFCLMPNHVHLLGEIEQKENLAKFMQGLNSSYTAYFNNKYDKVGHLWQDRFKSEIITKDRYLLDCIMYIELNPIKDALVKTMYEYKWSSHLERAFGANESGKMLDELKL